MQTIGFSSPVESPGLQRILAALGEVLDVRFEERTLENDHGIDAWILCDADRETLRRLAHSAGPSYAIIRSDQLVPCGSSSVIEFSRHDTLPTVLAGRRIKTDEVAELKGLPQRFKNMAVLASKADTPIWAMEEIKGQQHHYVASPIPEMNDGEPLLQYFHGNQFLFLLPLLIFLRALTRDRRWEQPPLQASFMFDDPNLHWRTYGFINFADIAEHAKMHNYHACFATIPLDTWFVHKPTALLFQQYLGQLSLLIHGNDHITQELAKPCSDGERTMNLHQALRRIDAFERRAGIEVAKVMAPPHGACSENTLGEMARLGFEAASISQGSLFHFNRQATWLRTFGMKPADIIRGLPVFLRFRISKTCHNSILIAALLDQPIIPVGHHHDLADGLQLLADLAEFINSLGTVHWTDMKRISRSHYARRLDGKILRIRMYTKRIEVCVPEEVCQIWVERPWLGGAESTPLMWKYLDVGTTWKLHPKDEPIPVLPGQKIEIVSELPTSPFIDAKNVRNIHLWPVIRRQLTEARDRLPPVLRRLSTSSIKLSKA
jgi:hypothetical protein